jgi:hypothetical protein
MTRKLARALLRVNLYEHKILIPRLHEGHQGMKF